MKYDYVIFASYGNDSIALIEMMKDKQGWESEKAKIAVLFSNTGWAADWWMDRVEKGEALAQSYGMDTFRTECEGMESLVKRKKGWPMGGGAAFCTAELKIKPALKWLDEHDPDGYVTCVIGVRREESANRATFPEWTESSEKHGGRELWAPMVRFTEEKRNGLIKAAGFKPLPHRSKECFPCVHANRADLITMEEERIIHVERIEKEMGVNSKGNPRVMFRPKRHLGAIGIRQVVDWANKTDGYKERKGQSVCDSGYCGM